MKVVRFGSYSTDATLPGMSFLSRLKSMIRYMFLLPPPIYLIALRPEELRPPVPFFFSTSDFSGVSVVTSAYAFPILQRVPAVIGLYFFNAMTYLLFQHLRLLKPFLISCLKLRNTNRYSHPQLQ